MTANWTFAQKLGAGFAVTVGFAIAIGAVGVYALRGVVESKDRVITVGVSRLVDAQRLDTWEEQQAAAARGFLLTREDRFLQALAEARTRFAETLARLRRDAVTDEGQRLLATIERAQADYVQAIDRVIALRRTSASVESVVRGFDELVRPARDALGRHVSDFVDREEKRLEQARAASTASAAFASDLVIGIGTAAVLLAALIAVALTRALGRQIGTAVSQVQSSAAELQASANQQATAAREQATAMSEITTTISELLATSRQIAESAQRVAQIAAQTTKGARSGEDTVQEGQESIVGIRRQVDLIVTHMLDLGKRSQQIGAVLDIVSELAEQTNILAINASIEAAGAGESGRRFAIVAEEIRKLADRVAGSTKEVRGLIEDVRGAVNSTVMTTESGSKAVEAGSKQFGEVAAAFKEIATLVATTTEAAREIELSTKQQSTAVEQVNDAVSNVAQATKETEAGSAQTLQTASQLAGLSRELLRLVQPQARA